MHNVSLMDIKAQTGKDARLFTTDETGNTVIKDDKVTLLTLLTKNGQRS